MNDASPPCRHRTGIRLLFAVAALTTVCATTWFVRDPHADRLLYKQPPRFEPANLFGTIAMACAAWLMIAALRPYSTTSPVITSPEGNQLLLFPAAAIFMSISLITVQMTDPWLFAALTAEDQLVENLSALLWWLAAIVCLATAIRRGTGAVRAWPICFAAGMFILGMEEVDWLQRYFEYDTPATIASANTRGVMNLHNINTFRAETIYMGTALITMVAIPMARAVVARTMKVLWPPAIVAVTAAVAFGLNYDTWNQPPRQFAFFMAIGVMMMIAMIRDGRIRIMAWIVAGATCFQQILWLTTGHTLHQSWLTSEIEEMIIPLAAMAYSVAINRRLETRPSADQPVHA